MARSELSTEKILEMLRSNPQRIAEITRGWSEAQLHTRPAPEEWSAVEVLAHLRACADVWGQCITDILASEHPTLRAIDPRTWAKRTDYPRLDYASSWQAYLEQRDALLEQLHCLTPAEWKRSARVTGAGRELERSIRFYAQWLARHEHTHLKQFRQLANLFHQV